MSLDFLVFNLGFTYLITKNFGKNLSIDILIIIILINAFIKYTISLGYILMFYKELKLKNNYFNINKEQFRKKINFLK
jgi:hypothetical protein